MKISVIGAGNVGGTLAQRLAQAGLGEVVLVDVIPSIAEGKAWDLQDARAILGYDTMISGTTDFGRIAQSDIVVVTAGLARQPGMSREDLLKKNADIAAEVTAQVKRYAPEAILLMVTNPLDILTSLALKKSGFPPERVLGMGGVLDSGRFANLIAEALGTVPSNVQALVIGAHGENMIPLARLAKVSGKPLAEILPPEKIDAIVRAAVTRGADIVSRLGKGSAYYAPSAAALVMVKAIINDEGISAAACAYCRGEYGLRDVCIGVPVILGRKGVRKIIELELTPAEHRQLSAAAVSVKSAVSSLA